MTSVLTENDCVRLDLQALQEKAMRAYIQGLSDRNELHNLKAEMKKSPLEPWGAEVSDAVYSALRCTTALGFWLCLPHGSPGRQQMHRTLWHFMLLNRAPEYLQACRELVELLRPLLGTQTTHWLSIGPSAIPGMGPMEFVVADGQLDRSREIVQMIHYAAAPPFFAARQQSDVLIWCEAVSGEPRARLTPFVDRLRALSGRASLGRVLPMPSISGGESILALATEWHQDGLSLLRGLKMHAHAAELEALLEQGAWAILEGLSERFTLTCQEGAHEAA